MRCRRADLKIDDAGSVQALEQISNWVRFADAKATILTAGFGVVLTAVLANWHSVATAIVADGVGARIVTVLAVLALIAGLATLYCLVRAIGPSVGAGADAGLNRFGWPSLSRSTVAEISRHAVAVPIEEDAWRQAILLAGIAARKFHFTGTAVWTFATFVVFGFASIATAISLGA